MEINFPSAPERFLQSDFAVKKEKQGAMENLKNNREKLGRDEPKLGEDYLLQMIENANKVLEGPDVMFKFSIHQSTHKIMVKVIDQETGKIIREIPPEKILDLVAAIWELAGILVDEKV